MNHWSQYHRAQDLPEALALLAAGRGQARVLAGGTDLILQLRQGQGQASALVDITSLPGLGEIKKEGRRLSIGALVTHAQAARDPLLYGRLTALAQACSSVGSPQIRNMGTIVGNVVSAQPGADAALALHAFATRVRVAGRAGERLMDLAELYAGIGLCCIDSCAELITHLLVEPPSGPAGSSFMRLSQRHTLSQPVINVAAALELEADGRAIRQARIALGPVAPRPWRARRAEEMLIGSTPTPEVLQRASAAAAADCNPRASLLRGSAQYRRAMAGVMTQRALEAALKEARGK